MPDDADQPDDDEHVPSQRELAERELLAMERLLAAGRAFGQMLVTIEFAASELGVSIRTVRRWIEEGTLRTVELSPRMVRIRADDLAALVERRTKRGGT